MSLTSKTCLASQHIFEKNKERVGGGGGEGGGVAREGVGSGGFLHLNIFFFD